VNTILTKLKDFVGISEHGDDEDTDYMDWDPTTMPDEIDQVMEGGDPKNRRNREPLNLVSETVRGNPPRNNVIGMPGLSNGIAEVVVIEPHSFEEMPQVIHTLRERKSVVLNLNVMNPEEAQRAVDFVAGGTFAIDGHQERIGESIFLFTPSCVKVSTLTGTVNDMPDAPKSQTRTTPSSTPIWGTEASRIAQ
jgi:cell division inhibitor SepF